MSREITRHSVSIARSIVTITTWMLLGAQVTSAAEVQKLERIEVVGSSIKRIDGETSLPVTIIKGDTLRDAGVTTAAEAIRYIAADQSTVNIANTTGFSPANLRGLGSNKTLVLLNGRRIANYAYEGGSVDLYAIPLAAIERIEILRDGASAIYGTDAIGGVINFVTRKNYDGSEISATIESPEKHGGGARRLTMAGGFGSLDEDRFNVLAVFDYRKQNALRSIDRDFAATGQRLDRGFTKTTGSTFPANIFQPATFVFGNPYFPGCTPPDSFSNPALFGPLCRFDFVRYIDLIPENQQTSFLTRGTLKISADHRASLEYMRTENKVITRSAPTPLGNLVMTPASPYFPGNGITPAMPGLNNTQPIFVNWRSVSLGQRIRESESVAERLVAELDGAVGVWDYRTGVAWARNIVTDDFTDGYAQLAPIASAVQGGNPLFLNPFGDPTSAEQAFLKSARVLGRALSGKGEVTSADIRASREFSNGKADPISIAIGAETRHEVFETTVNRTLVLQAIASGLELAQSASGTRNVNALFSELVVPITTNLETQLALRHDQYSDAGGTTNPKIAFRYQPLKALLLRASANTGFRAPTLYEMNQPTSISRTSAAFNDPILCPNGILAPGGNPTRDCRQQFNGRTGGNKDLEPEKSRTYSLGAVVEPNASFSASLDYWNILLKNKIGTLSAETLFGDPAKYASKFVRCSQLSAADASVIPVCADPNALAFVDAPIENLGDVKIKGFDLGLMYRFPSSAMGRVTLRYDGTYIESHKYQIEKNGAFIEKVGRAPDASRWQHVLSANWVRGVWSSTLINRFKSGYADENSPAALISPAFNNHVGDYSIWDFTVTWSGFKDVRVTAGLKNMLDEDPPFSNQNVTTQAGYDPGVTDPRGRTFVLHAAYTFK